MLPFAALSRCKYPVDGCMSPICGGKTPISDSRNAIMEAAPPFMAARLTLTRRMRMGGQEDWTGAQVYQAIYDMLKSHR